MDMSMFKEMFRHTDYPDTYLQSEEGTFFQVRDYLLRSMSLLLTADVIYWYHNGRRSLGSPESDYQSPRINIIIAD